MKPSKLCSSSLTLGCSSRRHSCEARRPAGGVPRPPQSAGLGSALGSQRRQLTKNPVYGETVKGEGTSFQSGIGDHKVIVVTQWGDSLWLSLGRRCQNAVKDGQSVAVHETVQTAARVLKSGFLLAAKQLHSNRLEHPGLHQSLAEARRFEAGHLTGAEEDVLHEVAEQHVHRIRAGEAVAVHAQVLPPWPHLHLRVKRDDKASPELSGAKRSSESC
ncbi:hypothetical protein JZ751_008829 [Albula glossodonta]|uniref:Uncharacterized protein n=1 Tax=Albula glossodonta TaxID=121402 RepID=A0A8T2NZB4_9TELE|nr:hypothetical protein JZ751_008829 [Albula glossodonta]